MPEEPSTRRPPPSVVLVARTHLLVGGAALASLLVLHLLTRNMAWVEFGPKTYYIAGGFGLTYCLAGVFVWLGTPVGRVLGWGCGLLYLARPQFGAHVWACMHAEEYKAYFSGKARGAAGEAGQEETTKSE